MVHESAAGSCLSTRVERRFFATSQTSHGHTRKQRMLWTLLLLPVLAAATVPMTGPNICTGNAVGGIWRKVIIPYECRTRDGMSNAECAALSTLWTTYFPYCCPYAAGYVPVPGAVQPTMFKGGVGAVPTWLLKLIVRPVSWVRCLGHISRRARGGLTRIIAQRGGQCAAKPVGCAVFYDCGSSPCKLACDNMGASPRRAHSALGSGAADTRLMTRTFLRVYALGLAMQRGADLADKGWAPTARSAPTCLWTRTFARPPPTPPTRSLASGRVKLRRPPPARPRLTRPPALLRRIPPPALLRSIPPRGRHPRDHRRAPARRPPAGGSTSSSL